MGNLPTFAAAQEEAATKPRAILGVALRDVDAATRTKLQEVLTAAGFYSGAVDGKPNKDLRKAVRRAAKKVAENSDNAKSYDLNVKEQATAFLTALAAGELTALLGHAGAGKADKAAPADAASTKPATESTN